MTRPTPPVLLFVVNRAPFLVSHRLPLAVAAMEAGLEVHVAAPRGPGAVPGTAEAVAVIEAAGIRVHDITLDPRALGPAGELRTLVSITRLYRRLRPDIVHHVTIKPILYGSLAARLTGIPGVVNAVPGLGYVFLAAGPRAELRRRAVMRGYRFAFAHPRLRTIFQNTADRDQFIGAGVLRPEQTVLIPGSGVDLSVFTPRPVPPGPPLVVLPARMLLDKGVAEFVAAARVLRGEGVDARFALVGDTDVNRAAVPREQLQAWHDEGVVEWWGARSDMPDVLAQAAIVCLPSYREGLSKSLLEAAAAGRPAVTTDVPGCRDAVRHGESGLLVPPRDAVALTDALRELIGHGAMRQRMGEAARRRAEEEFGIERVVDATLALYRSLLA